MLNQQTLDLEKQVLIKLYSIMPYNLTPVRDLSLRTLATRTNITPLTIGKVIQGLANVRLATIIGARGSMQYCKTQQNNLSDIQLAKALDSIHLQDGMGNITFLRVRKIPGKPKKETTNDDTRIVKPSKEVEVVVKEESKPITTSPTLQAEFGKYYFIVTPDNTIGYGRLETIQAVFDENTLLGYRYEIVTKDNKSYIVENLFSSVIEASKNII